MSTNKVCMTSGEKAIHSMRLKYVRYAQDHGVRACHQKYGVSRNTIKKWVDRYKEDPHRPLLDRRPKTTNHPDKMSDEWVEQICIYASYRVARELPIYAAVLQRRLCVPYSVRIIIKVLRTHGLYPDAKKPKKKKRIDLRHISAQLGFGETIQVDVKYLRDLKWIAWGIKRYELPKYQFTARDRATGAVWLGYAYEKSTTNTALFIEHVLMHLKRYGVDLSTVTIQTDNGTEFTTWWQSPKITLFEEMIDVCGAQRRCNPIGACTFNSAVESFHRTIEIECYHDMWMPTYKNFFRDVQQYQKHFNFERVNSYRGANPLALLIEKAPHVDPEVLELKPILIDRLLTREKYMAWREWRDVIV